MPQDWQEISSGRISHVTAGVDMREGEAKSASRDVHADFAPASHSLVHHDIKGLSDGCEFWCAGTREVAWPPGGI